MIKELLLALGVDGGMVLWWNGYWFFVGLFNKLLLFRLSLGFVQKHSQISSHWISLTLIHLWFLAICQALIFIFSMFILSMLHMILLALLIVLKLIRHTKHKPHQLFQKKISILTKFLNYYLHIPTIQVQMAPGLQFIDYFLQLV